MLETEFTTSTGTVRLVDCMPPRERSPDLVRVVEGVRGEVSMRMELIVRFDYGSIVPWVRRVDGMWRAIGGPDAVSLWSTVPVHGEDLTTQATFTVREGETVEFLLMWHPSHEGAERHVPPHAGASRKRAPGGSSGASSARTKASGATTCCGR